MLAETTTLSQFLIDQRFSASLKMRADSQLHFIMKIRCFRVFVVVVAEIFV